MKTILKLILVLSLFTSFGCSKKTSSIPATHNTEALSANEEFFKHPEEVFLYNPYQANADKIKGCAFKTEPETSCAVNQSPLIGIGNSDIEISDILDRTLSSRASYIETFRNVLYRMPKDSLKMFGSVNAIVISERIVPSFYHYASGAIYLSSADLWKTPEEKALITRKDYRESFGNTLQFTATSDYTKNGTSIYSSSSRNYRTDDQLAPLLIKLLFHELAHANDFFPKSFYSSAEVDLTKSYYQLTEERWENRQIISQNLKTNLNSEIMLRMGEVLYQGAEISEFDLSLSPLLVIDEFKNDVASDTYAYSTPMEDLAMLVEHSLMLHHYQTSAFTIFIKYPSANFTIPESYDYPIAGGIKDKIADDKVKERAQGVLENIFDIEYSRQIMSSLDLVKSKEVPEDISWESAERL